MQPFGQMRWLVASATLAASAYIGVQEIAHVIAGVQVRGQAFSPNVLYGFPKIGKAHSALTSWGEASCVGVDVRSWLFWLTGYDSVFILAYLLLLVCASRRWELGLALPAGALALFDAVENIVTWLLATKMPSAGSPACDRFAFPSASHFMCGMLIILNCLKWLSVVTLAGWVVARLRSIDGLGGWPRKTARALNTQRGVLIVVVILSVLLVYPGDDILNQGVDAERAWVLNDDIWHGLGQLAWAAGLMAALALVLRYTASVHIGAAEPDPVTDLAGGLPNRIGEALRSCWQWVVAAGLVALLAWAFSAWHWVMVYWPTLACLICVLVAVPVLNAAFVGEGAAPGLKAQASHDERVRGWKVGRLLAYSVAPLLLISFARSLTAPMVLGVQRGLLMPLIVVCNLAAVVLSNRIATPPQEGPLLAGEPTFPAPPERLRWLHPQLVGTRNEFTGDGGITITPPNKGLSLVPVSFLLMLSIAFLVVLAVPTATALGMIGVVAAGLIGLTAAFGLFIIASLLIDPPRVFRMLGMKRTPVVGLVLITAVASTFVGAGNDLHDVRSRAETFDADTRPALTAAASAWLDTAVTGSCSVPAGTLPDGRELNLLPMIFIAAEGGGIRAAWWTVDVLNKLVTGNECGGRSIFLASGASGGAVGLALAATSPSLADAATAVKKIAGPDALSAATDGLLTRDMLAGVFGINIRAVGGPADSDHFPDRAALIERLWQRDSDLGSVIAPGKSRVPWYTIYNGSSVTHACRVLISDVKFDNAPTTCGQAASPIPGAYDLIAAQPCMQGLRTATSALLASRFPYVTPSGLLRNCADGKHLTDQIIDGGYTDNSGLDSINDALLEVLPLVRAHNQAAVSAGNGPVTLTQPFVLFLHNKPTTAVEPTQKPPTGAPEPFVPLNGQSGILGKTSTLFARAGALAQASVEGITELPPPAREMLGNTAIDIAPLGEPQVGVPLGWTLSNATRKSLDDGLHDFLACNRPTAECAESRALAPILEAWRLVP